MQQLNLEFDLAPIYNSNDYIVTNSNEYAYNYITERTQWQGLYKNIIAVIGPNESGKTHLAHIWKKLNNASFIDLSNISNHVSFFTMENFIIDDLENVITAEKPLFYFLNYVINSNKKLLITSQKDSGALQIKIPDLASRLNAIYKTVIQEPDDELVRIILQKQFYNRQLHVEPEVIQYISHHIQRKYSSIKHIANELDKFSLLKKRSITIPFAKEVLLQLDDFAA